MSMKQVQRKNVRKVNNLKHLLKMILVTEKITRRQVKDIDDKMPPLLVSSCQRLAFILSISALSVLAVIL